MAQDSRNVASARPKVGGGLAVAPLGTPLPTDATTALDAAYSFVGYLSDAGITRTTDIGSESTNAWGGDLVWTGQSTYGETLTFSLLESRGVEALKAVYGDDNVTETGTGETRQIAVKSTAEEIPERTFVADMISGDRDRRLVVGRAKVSSRGDAVYSSTEPIALELEITSLPDENGVYGYEYISSPEVTP